MFAVGSDCIVVNDCVLNKNDGNEEKTTGTSNIETIVSKDIKIRLFKKDLLLSLFLILRSHSWFVIKFYHIVKGSGKKRY